jgi:CheY-like chemotaxis protein
MAVVPDLFFATKIAATAKALGVDLALTPLARATEAAATAPPALVLLDLQAPGDPPALIRALKADARTAAIPIVGFYPHVDNALRVSAKEAGIDSVMPRSAFVARLAGLLTGEQAPAAEPEA